MPTIQERILEEFYDNLSRSEAFDEAMVKQVRELFEADKKVNAADLVRVFSTESKENLP